VLTSKYTVLTFLPKNLFIQFQNLANLYFLLVGALQIIPAITTTDGVPTMYQPLAFIVAVSALRAGMEDWNKHKADRKRNGYEYAVYTGSGGGFEQKASGDLVVGDIVKVMENDMIPSDCIFLGSALEKGHCFIDKANLNGETKLEVLTCHPATKGFFASGDDAGVDLLSRIQLDLTYEPPNKRFDQFRGTFVVGGEEYGVDGKTLLMRETNLRNCAFIYGLVVYTGNDTKIQVSNAEGGKARTKVSWIMRQVNIYLRYMLLFQLMLCAGGGIGASIFIGANRDKWYLDIVDVDESIAGLSAFGTWFILLSQMVPISLIVSAEIVKFVMSMFIQWDFILYYPLIDKPTKCNSSTIHEDLGLIDYIFSDKTGTLTQNKMEFRYLMLNAGEWGSKETEIAKSVMRRKEALTGGHVAREHTLWTDLSQPLHAARAHPYEGDCFETRCNSCWGEQPPSDDVLLETLSANEFSEVERLQLLQSLWGLPAANESSDEDAKKKKLLKRYLRHCALSNTVKSYYDEGELRFQAESAEELAMVSFARTMGFTKVANNPTVLEIQECDLQLQETKVIKETYNHVATFGFTSRRARVTVILQNVETQDCLVMNKGQDTVVLPLCENPDGDDTELLLQLNAMSANGLRTLVASHAEHPAEWWEERKEKYQELVVMEVTPDAEGHSAGKCTPEKCVHCCQHSWFEQVEREAGLGFLGVVGMEDQLQLLVPEAIKDFLRAGIRVWMITGDKLETAKNIGLACNLIDPDMSPQLSEGGSLEEAAEAFADSRLIEVTGSWAKLSKDDAELNALFASLDHNADGTVAVAALSPTLAALKCNVAAEDLSDMFNKKKRVTREEFINVIRGVPLSMFEAVKADIDAGFDVYERIDNHEVYPISILVNRGAFQTMFPGKGAKPVTGDGKEITEKQLEELRERFFMLANNCKSVVFARAQPAMKKKMVTEIQKRVPAAVTLAIGDGANDTDMIMAAQIGVGIAGVEGTAATNSADYAVGTFRMLHTLLFKHGFWSYIRISKLVYFIFYKASLLAVSMYIFGPFSGWSGQQLFNDAVYQLYNVMYTALPVMMVAIFDKALTGEDAENNPVVYRATRGTFFTKFHFMGWVARAFLHCVILFGVPFLAMGEVADFHSTSFVVFQCVGIVPSFLILVFMENITAIHVTSIFLSLGALFLFNFALANWLSYNPDLYHVVHRIYADAHVWAIVFLTVMIPLLLELAAKGLMRQHSPSVAHVLKEKAYLQEAAVTSSRVHPGSVRDKSAFSRSKRLLTRTEEKAIVVRADNSMREVPSFNTARSKSSMKEVADRKAVMNTILRFRKLTGSQFDSAAQAQFQTHDTFSSKLGASEYKEHKTEEVIENGIEIVP
jgi:phospholipid-translocating P-type ATPase (flippase)